MTVQETFGKRLSMAMKAKGLNQKQMAKKMFCSQQTIQNYASGTRTPKDDMLIGIANELGVSIDWLYGRTDEMPAVIIKAEKKQRQEAQAELNEAMRKIFDAYGVDVK